MVFLSVPVYYYLATMITDYENYDTILVLDESTEPNPLFEAVSDPRLLPSTQDRGRENLGFFGKGQDPNAQFSLGPTLKSQLAGQLGRNYSVDVFDFGSDVTVNVKYSNPKTGLAASAAFLIKYNTKEGKGVVKSNSARWRTISSHSEALGYIKSRANGLPSRTGSAS